MLSGLKDLMAAKSGIQPTLCGAPALCDLVVVLRGVDWHQLGTQLHVPQQALKKIDEECHDTPRKLNATLAYWLNNEEASWEKIIEALERIGCHGNLIVELRSKYCRVPLNSLTLSVATMSVNGEQAHDQSHFQTRSVSKPTANGISKHKLHGKEQGDPYMSISTQTEVVSNGLSAKSQSVLHSDKIKDLQFLIKQDLMELKKKFITLQFEVRESVSKRVSPQKIVAHVLSDYEDIYENHNCEPTSLFSDADQEKLNSVASVDQVFQVLRKYWSFLKCEIFYSIVDHFGDESDQARVKEYQKQLETFFNKRKVSEVPEELMSSSSIDVMRDKMLIKLDKENPTWTAITDLEFRICEILGIKPSVLLIIGIQEGCVEITFSIPRHISQQIFRKSLTKEQQDQFRATSVLRLSCGDIHLIFEERKHTLSGEAGRHSTAGHAGLESKPKPSELQHLVKLHLAKRWEELGMALGLADEDDGKQLDKIRESQHNYQGLESKPKPSELQRLVKPHLMKRWEELGTALGLADEDDGKRLDEIRASRSGDSSMCFHDTMKLWLRSALSEQPVTWSVLIEAIKTMEGLEPVAAQIEAQLIVSALSDSANPSQPTTSTSQLPSTNESSPIIASVQPLDNKILALQSDGTSSVYENSVDSTSSLQAADETTISPSNDATPSSVDTISLTTTDKEPSPTGKSEKDSLEPQDSCELEGSHDIEISETESIPVSFDYTLKLGPGKQIREYQKELAKPGINGENYIVVAPMGSGKTLVAALVISNHLQKNQHADKKPKVVFIVNTKPLAEQQKIELKKFIPGAHVDCSIDDGGPAIFDLLPHHDIIVCTAGKILDAIKGGKVTFDMISLIVIDECHHTKNSSPQANIMLRYLKDKVADPLKVPQIMGLTASPGAGDNPYLEEKINNLINLCALMDATSGMKMVEEHQEELHCNTNKPSFTLEIPPSRSETEPFIQTIVHEMRKYEQTVPNLKCAFPKWSREYETIVQQLKQQLEISLKPEYRDQISTLRLLRRYSKALNMYMDLTRDDAISILAEYKGLPADDSQATPKEISLKVGLHQLLTTLRKLEPIENPLLNAAKEKLVIAFSSNPSSKGIVFVRTKNHALSICKWIENLPESQQYAIKPRLITGHTRETGTGMTQVEQNEVMTSFRESGCNLLIATSVAEEGLDVPACNLVIRFQHVSNEIAKTQTQGRARAEQSEGFTILASNSKKKLQELKNDELLRLVEECMQNKWFPKGQLLIQEIERRQRAILTHHQQKIIVRKQISSQHKAGNFRMMCKNCKTPACVGSDVYLIDGTFHHAVPDESFKEKIKKKPHKTPRQLTEQMAQTHKIYCAVCDSEWGIMATWPAKGKEFPVLKCKQFIFESDGQPRAIRKWSDAPFELADLSSWFERKKKGTESDSDEQ